MESRKRDGTSLEHQPNGHEQRRQQQQQHSQLSQEALMAWVEKQRATFVVRPRLVSLSESVKELITLD